MILELYTKPSCPVCNTSKQLLNSNGVDYTEIQIGRDIMRDDVLAKFPDAKTVPIIVLNGTKIDGYPSLKLLIEKDEIHG
jgi:glutaredoxin 3